MNFQHVSTPGVEEVISGQDYLTQYYIVTLIDGMISGYIPVVISLLFVTLNSMVNPIIYFWRIKHFR